MLLLVIAIFDAIFYKSSSFRSSGPEVFCKKDVLKSFRKFTGKQLCQGLIFNKITGLRPEILLKKRLWHRCEFCQISKNTFSHRTPPVAASIHWHLLLFIKVFIIIRKELFFKCFLRMVLPFRFIL